MSIRDRFSYFLLITLIPVLATTAHAKDSRPNILLIMADDLGYSDIGATGSEINTPNLDELAREGMMLSNLRVAPNCSPTRAMLMSGAPAHQAGLGAMAEALLDNQKGQPGYEGYLNFRAVSFVELLRDSGYRTYMAGKWHLGMESDQSPRARGFDQSFSLLQGGAHHFDQTTAYPTTPKAVYRDNGRLVEKLPENFKFSSDFFTDKLIEYIERDRATAQPFFAYAAYTAPHWPIQAPSEYTSRYKGEYDVGYEVIQENRINRMKELGLLPSSFPVQQLPSQSLWPSWDKLTPAQRERESRRMEVYAGMVDNLDYNIGRIISYLKSIGEYENTFIVFLSDNGPEGNTFSSQHPEVKRWRKWIDDTFDNSLENIGHKNSYEFQGPGWASVSATPHRLFKAFPAEGGVRTPAIMTHKGVISEGQRSHAMISVMDLAPTFLDLAQVDFPQDRYRDQEVLPMQGKSILPLVLKETQRIHDSDYALSTELWGSRSVVQDGWKILWMPKPFGHARWELFNLTDDPSESIDLAEEHPEILQKMLAQWERYAEENGVILPEVPAGY
ncbi:sulfatase-like hydrolase/transferase [Halopseudomonas sp. Lyrl_26]|uniref:arylsulfatase n=1 Tax=Halopseudomonas sp. Lyrl_26 TaxID=3110923 RepID=UPI003F7FB420